MNGRSVGFVVALEDVWAVVHLHGRHFLFAVSEVKMKEGGDEGPYVQRGVLPADVLPCDCSFYGMKHSVRILIPNSAWNKG